MKTIKAPTYVLGDHIDTDQIISAEFMKIDYSTVEGYQEIGKLAFCGLPENYPPVVDSKSGKAKYPIIMAGENFGCGSSREHAPVAMGSSGIQVVIAKSFARIFYRNCMTTGQILPLEADEIPEIETDTEVTVDLENKFFTVGDTSKKYPFRFSAVFGELVEAGGLFNYARQKNII